MSLVEEVSCVRYSGGNPTAEPAHVARESPVTVYVNGRELATLLCTPVKLNFLALGYLFSEGLIDSKMDVASMRVCDDELEVDVRLVRQDVELPEPRTLTSGCGGGARKPGKPVKALGLDFQMSLIPEQITNAMKGLLAAAETHREYGGMHTSAIGNGHELVLVSEDIGRHNTLDKIIGQCMMKGISTRDCLLVSTGRISSEMVLKAARMEAPVVISRGAVTGRTISLATELGITVIGYARGERFTVYTHQHRVKAQENVLAYSQGR